MQAVPRVARLDGVDAPVDDTVRDAEILVRALCRLGTAYKAEGRGRRLGQLSTLSGADPSRPRASRAAVITNREAWRPACSCLIAA